MKTDGLKILLIEPNKRQSELLSGILLDLNYQVIRANNINSATEKLIHFSPNLIVCQKNLNESSGFLFYNMLRNKLSNSETPFILLLNDFDKKDLSLCFEIGIEGCIYPPFESVKLANILHHQFKKISSKKPDAAGQFKTFFEATPFGFFICKNNIIVDFNKLFLRLVNATVTSKRHLQLTEIFDICSNYSNELALLRCLNGVSTYCSFHSIPLKSDPLARFDIFLNVVENEGTSLKIAGLIIQENQKNEQRLRFHGFKTNFSSKISDSTPKFTDLKENGFFTNREKQVLKLSAEGAPIKQIAQQMGISVRTVEKHRSNIFRKTNSENIVEAVFYANRKHLLEMN